MEITFIFIHVGDLCKLPRTPYKTNLSSPIRVYDNTGLNLTSSIKQRFMVMWEPFSIDLRNFLGH